MVESSEPEGDGECARSCKRISVVYRGLKDNLHEYKYETRPREWIDVFFYFGRLLFLELDGHVARRRVGLVSDHLGELVAVLVVHREGGRKGLDGS